MTVYVVSEELEEHGGWCPEVTRRILYIFTNRDAADACARYCNEHAHLVGASFSTYAREEYDVASYDLEDDFTPPS